MSLLNPTPDKLLVDSKGRPYFLWDSDLTLARFRELLDEGDPDTRAYLAGKLLRQAKPDDVFQFLTVSDIESMWPRLDRHLGHTRAFWRWLLDAWASSPHAA